MKKSIMLAIIALTGFACKAQVYKFKAIDSYLEQYDENGKDTSTGNWEKSGILVVIDFTKNKIKTFGETPQDYDLLNVKEQSTDIQGNTRYTCSGVDIDGEKCDVDIVLFKKRTSPNIANVAFKYSTCSLILRLKKDE